MKKRKSLGHFLAHLQDLQSLNLSLTMMKGQSSYLPFLSLIGLYFLMYDLVSCTIDCTYSCLDVQLCYPHHFSCTLFTNVFHLEINKVNLTIYSLLQNIGCDMVFFSKFVKLS